MKIEVKDRNKSTMKEKVKLQNSCNGKLKFPGKNDTSI